MTELYDVRQVVEKTGVGSRTVYRWAKRLRHTNLVRRATEGKTSKLQFTEDFVTFIRARRGGGGPQGLPIPEMVEWMFQLWHVLGDTEKIAAEIGQPVNLVEYRLKQIGIQLAPGD